MFLGRVAFCLALASRVSATADETKLPLPLRRMDRMRSTWAGSGEISEALVYQRRETPVEIIEEFDIWRRVVDYRA